MTVATRHEKNAWDVYESPIGPLTLELGPRGLRSLAFPGRRGNLDRARRGQAELAPAVRQLEEYFVGERQTFDLELDLVGSPLARAVWAELRKIPYGTTTTYGELARRVEHDNPRGIGACVGSTPVPIIVPCHRVIGADGTLRGYGGGLPRKRALLRLELRGHEGASPPCWMNEQLDLI